MAGDGERVSASAEVPVPVREEERGAETSAAAPARLQERASAARPVRTAKGGERDPFLRAENEDDDGYDPYSDRLPDPEPLFERDPWA